MSDKEHGFSPLSEECIAMEIQATAGVYEGFGHNYPDQDWQHFIDATTLTPIIEVPEGHGTTAPVETTVNLPTAPYLSTHEVLFERME